MFRFFTLALITLIFTGSLTSHANSAKKKPNILFIAIDDMKPLTGAYGIKDAVTPSLDLLASKASLFTHAYTQYPVCGPSRASLLTGLRPETNGVMNLKLKMRKLNPNALTLPQHFKNNGYQTAAVGKIFDPRNVDSRATDDPASWSIPFKQLRGKVDGKDKNRLAVRAIDAPSDQFVDGAINKRAKKLLQTMAKDDQPFFLAVGYKKPHLPFTAPKKFFDLYVPEQFELANYTAEPKDSDKKYILNNNSELRGYAPTPPSGQKPVKYRQGLLPENEQRELLHGYYAAVSYIDSLVADILKTLDETGQADNTIIVLWGDHGFHLGDHGLWGKHTTMEQATQVPFLIYSPGQKPQVITIPVELLDIFPTLNDMAKIIKVDSLQGDTLVPIMNGEKPSTQQVAISQYKRKGAYGYSMRTQQYRYTEWINNKGIVVYRDLYDLKNDPKETKNLAPLAIHKLTLENLAKLLRANSDGLSRLNK